MHDVNTVADRLRILQQEAAVCPLGVRVIVLDDLNLRFSEKPILDIVNQKATFKKPKHSKVANILVRMLRGGH